MSFVYRVLWVFERLMEIHSNPPILYYGFESYIHKHKYTILPHALLFNSVIFSDYFLCISSALFAQNSQMPILPPCVLQAVVTLRCGRLVGLTLSASQLEFHLFTFCLKMITVVYIKLWQTCIKCCIWEWQHLLLTWRIDNPSHFYPSLFSAGGGDAQVRSSGGLLSGSREPPRCEGCGAGAPLCPCHVVHPRPSLQRNGVLPCSWSPKFALWAGILPGRDVGQ